MLYFRYAVLIVMLMAVNAGADGIINTQTTIESERKKALEKLKDKKEAIQESIDKYKTGIEEGNEELKKSIKLIKAIIEIKKRTLVNIEEGAHHQQNTTKKE